MRARGDTIASVQVGHVPESFYFDQVHEKLVPSLESAEQVDVCGLLPLPTR